MNIYNNTSNDIYYSLTSPNSGDCGSLDAGQTAEWPAYDNQPDVSVTIAATPVAPNPSPFSVTIPDTGVGKVVTIGLFFE